MQIGSSRLSLERTANCTDYDEQWNLNFGVKFFNGQPINLHSLKSE